MREQDNIQPRLFNDNQKASALMNADWQCEICGIELTADNFQADHIHPYSKGGETTASNVQALCQKCNLDKSNQIPTTPRPSSRPPFGNSISINPRQWQSEFLESYLKHEADDYLLVASPGAGKTKASALASRKLMESLGIRQVVVVCPTRALKRPWCDDFHLVGLNVSPSFKTGRPLGSAYHGACVTYDQVASNPAFFANLTSRKPTLIVLDEIHHANDQGGWGEKIKEAFGDCWKRLCLSGTPFRSDGLPIPFLRYAPNKECQPDYSYSYGQAVADGVCRPTQFDCQLGTVSWMKYAPDYDVYEEHQAHFSDSLGPELSSQRLKAGISLGEGEQEFAVKMFAKANQRLTELRKLQPDAGGLLIASDQEQAKLYQSMIYRHTGESPSVVISEDGEKALESMRKFARGSSKWVVAVRMISEGIDIPRLRVLVYATNITAPLSFRQMVGRVIRARPDEPRSTAAYIFLPADPELLQHAQQMEDEAYPPADRETEDFVAATTQGTGVKREDTFIPMQGDITAVEIVSGGLIYTQQQKQEVEEELHDKGIPVSREIVEGVIKERQQKEVNPGDIPLYQRADQQRQELDAVIKRIVKKTEIIRIQAGSTINHAEEFRILNTEANKYAGIRKGERQHASPSQLARALVCMNKKEKDIDRGFRPWPEGVFHEQE